MAAGTGGSPSVTRLSFGVTTSDWANAGLGRKRAAVRRTHDSLDMCAPTGDVGGQSYGALSTVARCRGAACCASPIYSPPHSFPRTLDDGEGGGVTDYRYPDSHVFYRKLGRSYPRIVRGEGCWLYDEQGKGYLDAVGGAYVANLGHSNPEIAEALARQAREFAYATGAAFTAEPVVGSSAGASTPRREYFRTIREICDRHDVLFVADEILCGAGRTGSWWAIEPYGVAPDLMTLGKGISGGYAALSAVAAPERIVDVIANGSGSLLHGQTFSFHPVACAAGLAAVRLLKRDRLVERCAKLGRVLQRRLATLAELPHVGDVRGRGLLAGIEFVEDKATRAPFPRAAKFVEAFTEAAHGAGLVVWPNVGHADGVNGDLVAVAPPFIITEQEIEELVTRFTRAHAVALKAVKAGVR